MDVVGPGGAVCLHVSCLCCCPLPPPGYMWSYLRWVDSSTAWHCYSLHHLSHVALIYHQTNSCLLIPGIIVAEIFSRQQWIYNTSLKRYFSITLFLLVFTVGFYVLLKAVGVDLLWTLEKAQKWCVNPAWVLMDTTPFASLMRNMGTFFGLGLGLHSPLYNKSKKSTSTPFRIGSIVISLILLQLLDFLTFPLDNHIIFYILSFTKSTVALLVPTILVPRGLSLFLQESKVEKSS